MRVSSNTLQSQADQFIYYELPVISLSRSTIFKLIPENNILLFIMKEGWELPIILNESLKQKFISASLHLSPMQHSSPKKTIKRDLFGCLHRLSNKNHSNHKTKTKSQFSSITPASSQVFLNAQRPKKIKQKSRIIQTIEQKHQGLTITAFLELENYLKHSYTFECPKTLDEIYELKQVVLRGVSGLQVSLSQFKQTEKVFLDSYLSLLLHSLYAQHGLSTLQKDVVYHLARVQYFALKLQLLNFAVYSLSQQGNIHRQSGELQQALSCLKKGLSLAIQTNEEQIVTGMLEKLGMHFYYIGNTPIGGYYHRLAERGLPPKEREIYMKQLNLRIYVPELQNQLFGTKKSYCNSRKNLDNEAECSKIEKEEMQRQRNEQTLMISKMLKDNKLRKVGHRLKKHMGTTLSLASIITHNRSCLPQDSSSQNLPVINVSHVLKSHLSRNRGMSSITRQWQLQRLFELIQQLPE